ncbi:6,7-dimethyl-8-ribityllumazine synthase [Polynucleobacter sphagniphilus]|jgi:6,7-dimethyl-8-ribityllumazine synthase|uniref:6,7-dimethyl-8-ribityllumazine synthase n=2 Tax=Polynucleobacter sphagniphilus TaxID=1743169 RepID=A0AA43MB04_9BURK|nr:6,7-dimethyl-8-ribityllumazine synthase [Polynucleobacter sphagniphilus]MDH6153994.1 6,7-dimethyl-8-ribityllumazine synthase [Polynucleobacter sphagniphilus]MDH6240264.1 6,7-dimethyl-8-ribityllumazine synthase [Polynucleobacter sphagniphilus]MDH6248446.1 6,7-dimethyl-8-ribityllumazine synthase [Polynucleobacter sphagniphilus]MDH6298912.1 6,7-dimethyl-8-ribityllumazine synthase [Polynucleobacter sphagniphilus]
MIMTTTNLNGSVGVLAVDFNGQDLRIGIVQARFNEDHCLALRNACIEELIALGVSQDDIKLVTVPGALEIPFALQKMVETGEFDGLVALGAVIRGDTYHFELVSNESASGITRISLDSGLPIANGVLTCDTDEQAQVRVQVKGAECAKAVVEMANLALALTPDLDIEINSPTE